MWRKMDCLAVKEQRKLAQQGLQYMRQNVDIRIGRGTLGRNLMLKFWELHEKQAEQHGIRVTTYTLGLTKTTENLIDLACVRNFQIDTHFYLAVLFQMCELQHLSLYVLLLYFKCRLHTVAFTFVSGQLDWTNNDSYRRYVREGKIVCLLWSDFYPKPYDF
jgi:hypothetical protein